MTAATPSRGLRYVGLGDSTGYGIAAAAMVRALDAAGHAVAWEPLVIGPGLKLGYAPARSLSAGPPDLVRLRDDGRRCDRVVVHTVPEYYPHFVARERARGGGAQVWGSTVWETDRIPDHWPPLIALLDGLIVPTAWNRALFRAAGVTIPIAVVPHLRQFTGPAAGHDAQARLAARLPACAGRLVFYSIGTWLERKGWAPLVRAYTQAFRASDPVLLVLKTTPCDLERKAFASALRRRARGAAVAPQLARMRRWRWRPPPIALVTDALPEDEVQALHERGDCYVSLCRAEGWGLGAFEAGWLGKPVIMTGWGGQTAFLRPETSFLVDWRLAPVRPAVSDPSYTPAQNWAEPDLASAVAAMRAVQADPAAARARGRLLRQDLQRRFHADHAVGALAAALWRS
jgi:glycosyltransferase involved in cell wall biosynthesis